jgi:pyruvate-formate lyase-activating enzyme
MTEADQIRYDVMFAKMDAVIKDIKAYKEDMEDYRDGVDARNEYISEEILEMVKVNKESILVMASVREEIASVKKDVGWYNDLKKDIETIARAARFVLKFGVPLAAFLTFVWVAGKKVIAFLYSTFTCNF